MKIENTTSPADQIRAKLNEDRNVALSDIPVFVQGLMNAIEALLPEVEERAITPHDQDCALMMEYGRICRCGKDDAEKALLTAASALGAEHD